MSEYNTLGNNLKKYRKENKLTQHDLAGILEISQTYYGTIERGEKQPSRDLLLKVSDKLNLSLDVLMKDFSINQSTAEYMEQIDSLPKQEQELVYDIMKLVDSIVKRLLDFVGNKSDHK